MISDFFAAIVLGLICIASAVVIAGCIAEPEFADRCQHCGEYLEDAAAAHDHLARCSPCR